MDGDEWAEDADPPTDEEFSALARKEIAASLKALARIGESGKDPNAVARARCELEEALVRIKARIENPATPACVRWILEKELRKFRQS